MKVTIGQKSIGILRGIKAFLSQFGIHSVIYSPAGQISSLEVGRADDLVKFLRLVKPIVKRRQVVTALAYLEGRIRGNRLLQVFDQEYRFHKRKRSPVVNLGLKFPLTRYEAVEVASAKAAEARLRGNHRAFLSRVEKRCLALPKAFDVKDIQQTIGVSRSRAQALARIMEELHLVTCRYEKVPPRFHRLVCERISPKSAGNEATASK